MRAQDVKIGLEVVRSKGDYVVGYTGVIIEIDEVRGRARVDWKETVKTWVSFSVIEPTSIPYEIVRPEKLIRDRRNLRVRFNYPKYKAL